MLSCLIGCIWQVGESADHYFKYPTVSQVSIQPEDPITIPAVTLCNIPLMEFKNHSYASAFKLFQNDSFYFIHYDGLIEKVIIHDYFCLTVFPKNQFQKDC